MCLIEHLVFQLTMYRLHDMDYLQTIESLTASRALPRPPCCGQERWQKQRLNAPQVAFAATLSPLAVGITRFDLFLR